MIKRLLLASTLLFSARSPAFADTPVNPTMSYAANLIGGVRASVATNTQFISDLFSDRISPRMYGAKCDGYTDDTVAFENTALVATGQASSITGMAASTILNIAKRLSGNQAIEIDIPSSRCLLSAPWAVNYGPNTSILFHGDGSAATELEWTSPAGSDGLVVTFNQTALGNEASRTNGSTPGQGIRVEGIHFMTNTTSGDVGRALVVIGTPLLNSTTPPMQVYKDLLFSNVGGWFNRANSWAGAMYLQDPDNAFVENVQYVDHSLLANQNTIDFWVHSTTASNTATGHGDINFDNVLAFGGKYGLLVDGIGLQGINVQHLNTTAVKYGFSWKVDPNSNSGSLTLEHSSMGADVTIVDMKNVSTVFMDDNFFYNVAPTPGHDFTAVSILGGDTFNLHGNTYLGPTAGWMGTGYTATALLAYHYQGDVQQSIIHGENVTHFDRGYIVAGGPMSLMGDRAATDTALCYQDYGGPTAATHPDFNGMQCGNALNNADGLALSGETDWAPDRFLNGATEIGAPGLTSPAFVTGYSGVIDWHSFNSGNTFAGMNDYDCRDSISGGVAGTSGMGTMTHTCAKHVFGGEVDVSGITRFNGSAILHALTINSLPASCVPGDEAFAKDALKPNETSGAGTGIVAMCSPTANNAGSQWTSTAGAALTR